MNTALALTVPPQFCVTTAYQVCQSVLDAASVATCEALVDGRTPSECPRVREAMGIIQEQRAAIRASRMPAPMPLRIVPSPMDDVDADPIEATLTTWTERYGLTPLQREVLALTAQGFTARQVAELRGVCKKSVNGQGRAIRKKLGVDSISWAALRLVTEALELSTGDGQ